MTSEFITRVASWDSDKAAIMQVRHVVFVEGQNVPSSLESDSFDAVSSYILAESSDGTPIGCARLQPNGKLTRIAVLEEWRRKGIAREMLAGMIKLAKSQGIAPLYLHAQLTAIALYEEFGFVQTGDEFEEAGIQHIKMTKSA